MRRVISVLLSIMLAMSTPAHTHASEYSKNPSTSLGKQVYEYMKSRDDDLLLLSKNYGYVSFINDFKADALSVYLLEMTDKLINTGAAPDKEQYMETLVSIIAAYDQDRAGDLAKQKMRDNLKSSRAYIMDMAEMGVNAVNVMVGATQYPSELEKGIKTAVNGLDVLIDNTNNWIEALSNLETIMQDYSSHDAFLNLIEKNSSGELQEAARTLRQGMKTAIKIKLDTYNEVKDENFENYEEFFFSDAFFATVKHTPEYLEDEAFAGFVDIGDKIVDGFGTLKSAWDLGKAIGTMVGDVVVGGENLIKRILEIMALSDISDILSAGIHEKTKEFISNLGTDNELRISEEYISLSNYLMGTRIRGEYTMYSIVAKDAGLLSWFDKQSAQEALRWYENKTSKIVTLQNNLLYGRDVVHISGIVIDTNGEPAVGLHVILRKDKTIIFEGETSEGGFFEGTAEETEEGDATIDISDGDLWLLGSTLPALKKGKNDLGVFHLAYKEDEDVMIVPIDKTGEKEDIIEQYKSFLQSQRDASDYLIYDIDKDGYPEILIENKYTGSDYIKGVKYELDIYSYNNGEFSLLDTWGPGGYDSTYVDKLASYPVGNGILSHSTVWGHESIVLYRLVDGVFEYEIMYEGIVEDSVKYYKEANDQAFRDSLYHWEHLNHQYYQSETSSPYCEGSLLLAQSSIDDFTAVYEAFEQEKLPESKNTDSYDSLLVLYAKANAENWDRDKLSKEGLNYQIPDLGEVGYYIEDINNDQIPELMIGAITPPYEDFVNSIIDMYTLDNGHPKKIFKGTERVLGYLSDNGILMVISFGGAEVTSYEYDYLDPDNLEFYTTQSVYYDGFYNSANPWYSDSTHTIAYSEEEARDIMAQYPKRDMAYNVLNK